MLTSKSITLTLISILIVWMNLLHSNKISVECYNLSPKPNVIIRDPSFPTHMPKYESSYFGFTINLRPLGIIVGAPRAQSTFDAQRKINETGAIYRCSHNRVPKCNIYVFENRGNINAERGEYSYDSEKRDFQWLGASMDGGTKDTDKLVVCAPRLIAPAINDYLMHGICYWINDTLTEKTMIVHKISPLRDKKEQIRREGTYIYFYYMLGEQGLSVHITPDNEEFLIGAPGIHTWRGSVIRHRRVPQFDEQSRYRRDASRQTDNETKPKLVYGSDIPNPEIFGQPSDSYFGYSVGSGFFDSNNRSKLLYVATAPQANNQSGEAYIFDIVKKKLIKHYVFRGLQFGEYFGYAILAEDINGDGLSDVIVSAPQHSIDGFSDDGAIYVFINQGRFNFETKVMISPLLGGVRFGTTLSKLGDINKDGFNDIAVGAPFAGDGSVFVYLGSERGLREHHCQRLDYPSSVQSSYGTPMFGHGLSKGADVNEDGFNDFAIGAPNAEAVFLYQAYPVVSIKATISLQSREIKPEQTSFPVTVCYSIATASTKFKAKELAMHIVIDPQLKRVQITSANSHELHFNVTAREENQCRVLDCNVRFSVGDIFKPIKLELHYKLVHGIPDSEEFCEICAAVEPTEPKDYVEKIIFSTGCATDICVADMRVNSSLDKNTFIAGSTRTFKVSYEITNMGETAYLPQINITSSNRMPFARVPSNCKLDNQDNVLLCDMNHGQPMGNGDKDTITIVYDTSGVTGSSMNLTAKVFSTGKELNPINNYANDLVTLMEFTEIEAVGTPKTAPINLEEMSNTAEIINFYKIKSNGPSNVDAMEIALNIPVAYTMPGTSKTIPIVDMNNIAMEAIYDAQNKDIEFTQNNTQILMNAIENMSSYSTTFSKPLPEPHEETAYSSLSAEQFNDFSVKEESFGGSVLSTAINRVRGRAAASLIDKKLHARIARSKSYELLDDDVKGTLPVNRTIVFSCSDPEMTTCVRASIRIYDFKPNKPVVVTMKYLVDLQEVNHILIKHWEFFVILVGVDIVKPNDPSGKTLTINKKIDYNIISKHLRSGPSMWIIILAVIGGLLALALLTYGMYKAGFFKRAKKEEMEKLVHRAKLSKNQGAAEATN